MPGQRRAVRLAGVNVPERIPSLASATLLQHDGRARLALPRHAPYDPTDRFVLENPCYRMARETGGFEAPRRMRVILFLRPNADSDRRMNPQC